MFGFSEQRVTESVLKINEEISWVSLIYDDLLVLSAISFKFCFYIFYFIQHVTVKTFAMLRLSMSAISILDDNFEMKSISLWT